MKPCSIGLCGEQDSPAPLSTTTHTPFPDRGLPTDRYMWSDISGLQERTKAGTKPPSLQWTWVSTCCPHGMQGDMGKVPALTRPFPRFLTGSWTSVFLGARTRRDGSMPATSLREHFFGCGFWGTIWGMLSV